MAAVRPYGARVEWEEYVARFVGRTDVWAGRTLLASVGAADSDDAEVDGRVDAVRRAKHAYFRERAPERLVIAAETITAVRQVAYHLSLAVVSSSPVIDVEPTLERAGLRAELATMVCGNHVRRHKPDPEPYRLALERVRAHEAAGVADLEPAECVVFEDSSSGVASAEAAGMQVVRVDAPGNLPRLIEASLRRPTLKVR